MSFFLRRPERVLDRREPHRQVQEPMRSGAHLSEARKCSSVSRATSSAPEAGCDGPRAQHDETTRALWRP